MKDEVVRLASHGSGSSEIVQTVLASAKAADPSAAQLAGLTARLAAALPAGALAVGAASAAPAAGAGAAAVTGVKGALSAKIVIGLATLVVASAAVWTATRTPSPRPAASAATTSALATGSSAPVAASAPEETRDPAVATGKPPVIAPRANAASSAAPAAAPAAPAEPEAVMLSRAHDALLRGAPGAALAITEAHGRAYPAGALAQEREMIAIEALVKSGNGNGARARAAAFRRHYPGSSHLPRLEAMVAP